MDEVEACMARNIENICSILSLFGRPTAVGGWAETGELLREQTSRMVAAALSRFLEDLNCVPLNEAAVDEVLLNVGSR